MKIALLITLMPITIFAQNHAGKIPGKPAQIYSFHYLTDDHFLKTVPDNGGTAVYKSDTVAIYTDGEIEINTRKKYFMVKYLVNKQDILKARIDGEPKYNKVDDTYTYRGHWMDSNEKTEISVAYNDAKKIIKILFGPHKGNYAIYWDKIIKYSVLKKE